MAISATAVAGRQDREERKKKMKKSKMRKGEKDVKARNENESDFQKRMVGWRH